MECLPAYSAAEALTRTVLHLHTSTLHCNLLQFTAYFEFLLRFTLKYQYYKIMPTNCPQIELQNYGVIVIVLVLVSKPNPVLPIFILLIITFPTCAVHFYNCKIIINFAWLVLCSVFSAFVREPAELTQLMAQFSFAVLFVWGLLVKDLYFLYSILNLNTKFSCCIATLHYGVGIVFSVIPLLFKFGSW